MKFHSMAYSANFQDLMESEYSNQQVTFKPLLDASSGNWHAMPEACD